MEVAEKLSWVEVCSIDDVPKNAGACVEVSGKQIAVYNFEHRKEWYATDNECPHKKQMALSRGMIGDAAGEPKVACPFHKKTFSLKNGACLSGEEYKIATYPIKVENGRVFIAVS
ncbi:MAG: nitrite reductase small subunit NirD [Cytophagaceae bacterium]|jgi:nitrite reductase (NADH) small subunit|nr:nitrite reductase small subunit NirD [Cytophagaceae bacterium]